MATSRGADCCSLCLARLSSSPSCIAVPAAAQAQDTGTYSSAPLEWGHAVRLGRLQRRRARSTSVASRPRWRTAVHARDRPRLRRDRHRPGARRRLCRAAPVGRRGRQRRRRLLPPRRGPAEQRYQCIVARRGARSRSSTPGRVSCRVGRRHRHRARGRDRRRQGRFLPRDRPTGRSARRDRERLRRRASPTTVDPATVDGTRLGRRQRRRHSPTSAGCSAALACTLVDRYRSWGATQSTRGLDLGYAGGRRGRTSTATGRADYCRKVGDAGADQRIALHPRHAVGLRRQLHLPAAGVGKRDGLRVGGLQR